MKKFWIMIILSKIITKRGSGMKKILLIILFGLFMWGCEEKTDEKSPTSTPPLVNPLEGDQEDQNTNDQRIAVSPKDMEVFADLIGKPVDQITREDLLKIRLYYIEEEEDDIGDSLRFLENLETLNIFYPIKDYSFIRNLSNLKSLHISRNHLDSIEFLTGLEKLESLHIQLKDYTDLSPLSTLSNLKSLVISIPTVDIHQLPILENLEELSLYNNEIVNLSELKNFPNLHSLTLYGVYSIDIDSLLNLHQLESLGISETYIESLEFINDMENIKHLVFYNSLIHDLTPLEKKTDLKSLDIMGANIYDLSPLANLQELEFLNIAN